MSELWVFIAIAALVLGAFALSSWQAKQAKRRADAWRSVAAELGLDYLGPDNDLLERFRGFRLFSRGRSRRIPNAVHGDSGDTRITVADYRYRTGSGKNSRNRTYTVCILQTRQLDLPWCHLRPESAVFDFLGGLLGGQDFDFFEDAEFSAAYVLQGEDEAAVRGLFDARTRAWFAARRDRRFHLEANRDALMFHTGRRLRPAQARELMQQALEIKGLLAGRNDAA